MTEKIYRVKYKCQHPSCVVHCREGVLELDEQLYSELSGAFEEQDIFKSPRWVCRMGFPQQFKALSADLLSAEEIESLKAENKVEELPEDQDPIKILMKEHQEVLRTLDTIEDYMKTRDMQGLWKATAELLNEVTLHSIKKEEEALFPHLRDNLPFADGLIAIVKEDHAEFLGLLASFRNGLEDGEILDGIGDSTIVNLRNHIRKEDLEFFELINNAISNEIKADILKDMDKAVAGFVPYEPGDLDVEKTRQSERARKRRQFDEEASAAREATLSSADAGAGGCCGH